MLFLHALLSAIRGTFVFSGRSDRLEQWTFAFLTAVCVVGVLVASDLGVRIEGPTLLVLFLGGLWMLMAHVSLFVRRLHDNNRSGLYMLIPAAAASVWLAGWLGMNGYIEFQQRFFLQHGDWVMRGGRAACGMCGGLLTWIFLSEGDEDENDFGDPPL